MSAIYRMRFLSLELEGTAREIAYATGLGARLVRNECGAMALSNGRVWDGTITEPFETQTAPQKALQR